MKIAIGVRVQAGPWGGGNQFAVALGDYLRARGDEVSYDLSDPALDVLLLTEPRRTSASSAFNDVDILDYVSRRNARAVVVHRVNECDERKQTNGVNRRLELANRCADATVFISDWLKALFERRGARLAEPCVIPNGGDTAIFHPANAVWNGREPIRLVTHHWSDHWMKGFDVYAQLDELLGRAEYASAFSFTYIGKLPAGFRFRHADVQAPRSGRALAELLAQHHVYLTASMNEPAGMHHIEGALCGLPVLYRQSGALPEYCSGFGLAFDAETFASVLSRVPVEYARLKAAMPGYPYTADRMCRAYAALFDQLAARKDEIVARRRLGPAGRELLRGQARLYDSYRHWSARLAAFRSRFS